LQDPQPGANKKGSRSIAAGQTKGVKVCAHTVHGIPHIFYFIILIYLFIYIFFNIPFALSFRVLSQQRR
jgi:hypothetical protein